ncbi:MAG: hypothetical protein AABY83_03685 [Pseudomonadota bacterium]
MPWPGTQAIAGEIRSCYEINNLAAPAKDKSARALYIFIDTTMPYDNAIKNKVRQLIGNWGRAGDMVKLARFAAGLRGKYPELLFAESLDSMPDETYLYNLRRIDKQTLFECFDTQKTRFLQVLNERLNTALTEVDSETPRTELLFALRELSQQLILTTDAAVRNVLIVSDGMENSAALSFYKNKKIGAIDPQRTIAKVRKLGLIANWKNTNIYMYGIGLMPKDAPYVKAAILETLRGFWERYFVEGNGLIRGLGAPDLFVTTID